MSTLPGSEPQRPGARASLSSGPVTSVQRGAALLLDLAAVVLFAYLGRGAHEGGRSLADVIEVALPFLLARIIAIVLTNQDPVRLFPGGVVAWLLTWSAGMGIRSGMADGTAAPFVLVALGVLGGLFLAWRLVWLLAARAARRRRRS